MRRQHPTRRITDQQLAAMMAAFAGAEQPVLAARRPERWRLRVALSRRSAVLLAAGVVALAATVPAVALLGGFSETPKQFLADTNEPVNAKQMIKNLLSPAQRDQRAYQLTSVQRVVSAETPQGEVRLYAFEFSNGYRGSAMMSVANDSVSGGAWGPPASCPSGWALRAGGSFVQYPGRTPLFFSGQASDAVGSVDIVYPDGNKASAVLSNGYFLGWVIPSAGNNGTRANFSPPVEIVARDHSGSEIGRLHLRSDGDIPPLPGQPAQAIPCG